MQLDFFETHIWGNYSKKYALKGVFFVFEADLIKNLQWPHNQILVVYALSMHTMHKLCISTLTLLLLCSHCVRHPIVLPLCELLTCILFLPKLQVPQLQQSLFCLVWLLDMSGYYLCSVTCLGHLLQPLPSVGTGKTRDREKRDTAQGWEVVIFFL